MLEHLMQCRSGWIILAVIFCLCIPIMYYLSKFIFFTLIEGMILLLNFIAKDDPFEDK